MFSKICVRVIYRDHYTYALITHLLFLQNMANKSLSSHLIRDASNKYPHLFFVAVFRGNQKTTPYFQRTSLQPQRRSKTCDRIFQAQQRFYEPASESTTFAVEDWTVSSLHHPISFDELAQFGSKLAAGINCTSSSPH